MNKLFSKIATLSVGLAMAIGVGVAVGSRSAKVVRAATTYELVTDIESLSDNDKVVIIANSAEASGSGVSGFNGTKDATISEDEESWVQFVVGSASSSGWTLYDEDAGKYIASPSGNEFKYATSGGICSVDENGVLTCNSRLLSVNGSNYRFYGSTSSYDRFYVWKVEGGSGPVVTYTISYNSNGGSGTMSDSTGSNPSVAECTFTAPEGKQFQKWNTAANGSGADHAAGSKPKADLTLYAIWEDKPESHAGTAEDPFTVAEAIAKCKENGTTAKGPWVTKGIISKKTTWDSRYTNVTYWISDDGTGEDDKTKTVQCFRGKYLAGADVTSSNEGEFAVGKIVTVTGNLVNYSNNTPEYAQNNYPLSIEEPSTPKYSVVSRIDNGGLSLSEIYEGTELNVSVVPEVGYWYPSSLTFVRVAGVDVPYTYANGVVTVAGERITGNVTIEGVCVESNPLRSIYAIPAGYSTGTVYGYYVGYLGGSGPIIMNGEYGILLYGISEEAVSAYTAGESILAVSGLVDHYNGLGQIKSASISAASGEYPAPATPVVYAAAGGETTDYANRLTTVTGVPAIASGSKGDFSSAAGTNDITMNVTVGSNNIQVFYKKAAQTADADAYAAAKAAVEGSSEITIKGFTSWYNGFQVQMNGYVKPSESYTAEAFAQDLLEQTDAVCAGWEEGDNNHDAIEAIWSNLASNDKYPSLPSAEKTKLAEAERDEGGTVVEQAMARYDFLTGKYGLSNFINGRTPIVPAGSIYGNLALEGNPTIVIVIAIATASTLAFTLLLVFKKRKHN